MSSIGWVAESGQIGNGVCPTSVTGDSVHGGRVRTSDTVECECQGSFCAARIHFTIPRDQVAFRKGRLMDALSEIIWPAQVNEASRRRSHNQMSQPREWKTASGHIYRGRTIRLFLACHDVRSWL
jgi:hypothetical protein